MTATKAIPMPCLIGLKPGVELIRLAEVEHHIVDLISIYFYLILSCQFTNHIKMLLGLKIYIYVSLFHRLYLYHYSHDISVNSISLMLSS